MENITTLEILSNHSFNFYFWTVLVNVKPETSVYFCEGADGKGSGHDKLLLKFSVK